MCPRKPHLSPSSRLLYPPFVSQLWTAAAASALQSFVSQLWTSQALVAECSDIEKHKLFGVYGGVMLQVTLLKQEPSVSET